MLQQQLQLFVQGDVIPSLKEIGEADRIPRDLYERIAAQGYLGINLPEEYGGQPADWISLGMVCEEIGKADIFLGLSVASSTAVARALVVEGSETLKERWVSKIIQGQALVCHALTEPDCGSDAVAIRTRADRQGDYYILNGEKTSISVGMQADLAMVYAKTDVTAGARGVSCFVLPLDLPGISKSLYEDMGLKMAGRASLIFDDVKVPKEYRLGPEGEGFPITMKNFDILRVCVALTGLGAARASMEDAISFAQQRMAFGRPIAKFEGVSFKIAENTTFVEAARLLCYHALWLRDQGQPHTKESAMCKWWGPKVAVEAAIHDALLIHGHIGYSREYPLEQRLRDAIGIEMGDGTAEIMKIIICRELMGKEFLPY